ncbi:MAG: class I SAM-dependent methyltransferase [Polyangiaceae bacterium]|nr:class I SAM-dependent methyltransferase [Polyangiaceae bacterium]
MVTPASSADAARGSEFACPGCSALRYGWLGTKSGYTLVRCQACGLGRTLERPTQEATDALYTDPAYFVGGEYYLDYLRHESGYRALARRVVSRVRRASPRAVHWYDVGAAAGFYLDEARRSGFSVSGAEPSATMCEVARSRLGLSLENVTFERASVPAQPIDVVSFCDSLEHFQRPDRALRQARRWLRPGGLVVVHTPNLASPLARLLGARWPHFTPPEHLFYFDPPSLCGLLARLGFRVSELGTLGHYFRPRELLRKGLGWHLPGPERLALPIYVATGDLFCIARTPGPGP